MSSQSEQQPNGDGESKPTFQTLMLKHGFLSPRSSSDSIFGMWLRVCEDEVVRERSNARMARNRPHHLPTVTAGFIHVSAVLNAMTKQEIHELRLRLNIRPVREYAVQQH
jgi:hypothetical protein